MIFFDVLGWFFVYYPESTGVIINISVCVLACITIVGYIWIMSSSTGMFRRRIWAKFGILTALQVAGVALGIGLVISIALFLDAVNLPMSWFAQNWMLFGLYFCPMIFGMGIVPAIYFSRTKEVSSLIVFSFHLHFYETCFSSAWSSLGLWDTVANALALLDSDHHHDCNGQLRHTVGLHSNALHWFLHSIRADQHGH